MSPRLLKRLGLTFKLKSEKIKSADDYSNNYIEILDFIRFYYHA